MDQRLLEDDLVEGIFTDFRSPHPRSSPKKSSLFGSPWQRKMVQGVGSSPFADESSIDIYGDLSMDSIHVDVELVDENETTVIENKAQDDAQGSESMDLFTDILVSDLSEKEKLQRKIKDLEEVNRKLLAENQALQECKEQASKNLSSLILTARCELQQRDEELNRLRKLVMEFKQRAAQGGVSQHGNQNMVSRQHMSRHTERDSCSDSTLSSKPSKSHPEKRSDRERDMSMNSDRNAGKGVRHSIESSRESHQNRFPDLGVRDSGEESVNERVSSLHMRGRDSVKKLVRDRKNSTAVVNKGEEKRARTDSDRSNKERDRSLGESVRGVEKLVREHDRPKIRRREEKLDAPESEKQLHPVPIADKPAHSTSLSSRLSNRDRDEKSDSRWRDCSSSGRQSKGSSHEQHNTLTSSHRDNHNKNNSVSDTDEDRRSPHVEKTEQSRGEIKSLDKNDLRTKLLLKRKSKSAAEKVRESDKEVSVPSTAGGENKEQIHDRKIQSQKSTAESFDKPDNRVPNRGEIGAVQDKKQSGEKGKVKEVRIRSCEKSEREKVFVRETDLSDKRPEVNDKSPREVQTVSVKTVDTGGMRSDLSRGKVADNITAKNVEVTQKSKCQKNHEENKGKRKEETKVAGAGEGSSSNVKEARGKAETTLLDSGIEESTVDENNQPCSLLTENTPSEKSMGHERTDSKHPESESKVLPIQESNPGDIRQVVAMRISEIRTALGESEESLEGESTSLTDSHVRDSKKCNSKALNRNRDDDPENVDLDFSKGAEAAESGISLQSLSSLSTVNDDKAVDGGSILDKSSNSEQVLTICEDASFYEGHSPEVSPPSRLRDNNSQPDMTADDCFSGYKDELGEDSRRRKNSNSFPVPLIDASSTSAPASHQEWNTVASNTSLPLTHFVPNPLSPSNQTFPFKITDASGSSVVQNSRSGSSPPSSSSRSISRSNPCRKSPKTDQSKNVSMKPKGEDVRAFPITDLLSDNTDSLPQPKVPVPISAAISSEDKKHDTLEADLTSSESSSERNSSSSHGTASNSNSTLASSESNSHPENESNSNGLSADGHGCQEVNEYPGLVPGQSLADDANLTPPRIRKRKPSGTPSKSKLSKSLFSSKACRSNNIMCTPNLIVLGDEEATSGTLISPCKPVHTPSDFYPPGVRMNLQEVSTHRHIRGEPELLHAASSEAPGQKSGPGRLGAAGVSEQSSSESSSANATSQGSSKCQGESSESVSNETVESEKGERGTVSRENAREQSSLSVSRENTRKQSSSEQSLLSVNREKTREQSSSEQSSLSLNRENAREQSSSEQSSLSVSRENAREKCSSEQSSSVGQMGTASQQDTVTEGGSAECEDAMLSMVKEAFAKVFKKNYKAFKAEMAAKADRDKQLLRSTLEQSFGSVLRSRTHRDRVRKVRGSSSRSQTQVQNTGTQAKNLVKQVQNTRTQEKNPVSQVQKTCTQKKKLVTQAESSLTQTKNPVAQAQSACPHTQNPFNSGLVREEGKRKKRQSPKKVSMKKKKDLIFSIVEKVSLKKDHQNLGSSSVNVEEIGLSSGGCEAKTTSQRPQGSSLPCGCGLVCTGLCAVDSPSSEETRVEPELSLPVLGSQSKDSLSGGNFDGADSPQKEISSFRFYLFPGTAGKGHSLRSTSEPKDSYSSHKPVSAVGYREETSKSSVVSSRSRRNSDDRLIHEIVSSLDTSWQEAIDKDFREIPTFHSQLSFPSSQSAFSSHLQVHGEKTSHSNKDISFAGKIPSSVNNNAPPDEALGVHRAESSKMKASSTAASKSQQKLRAESPLFCHHRDKEKKQCIRQQSLRNEPGHTNSPDACLVTSSDIRKADISEGPQGAVTVLSFGTEEPDSTSEPFPQGACQNMNQQQDLPTRKTSGQRNKRLSENVLSFEQECDRLDLPDSPLRQLPMRRKVEISKSKTPKSSRRRILNGRGQTNSPRGSLISLKNHLWPESEGEDSPVTPTRHKKGEHKMSSKSLKHSVSNLDRPLQNQKHLVESPGEKDLQSDMLYTSNTKLIKHTEGEGMLNTTFTIHEHPSDEEDCLDSYHNSDDQNFSEANSGHADSSSDSSLSDEDAPSPSFGTSRRHVPPPPPSKTMDELSLEAKSLSEFDKDLMFNRARQMRSLQASSRTASFSSLLSVGHDSPVSVSSQRFSTPTSQRSLGDALLSPSERQVLDSCDEGPADAFDDMSPVFKSVRDHQKFSENPDYAKEVYFNASSKKVTLSRHISYHDLKKMKLAKSRSPALSDSEISENDLPATPKSKFLRPAHEAEDEVSRKPAKRRSIPHKIAEDLPHSPSRPNGEFISPRKKAKTVETNFHQSMSRREMSVIKSFKTPVKDIRDQQYHLPMSDDRVFESPEKPFMSRRNSRSLSESPFSSEEDGEANMQRLLMNSSSQTSQRREEVCGNADSSTPRYKRESSESSRKFVRIVELSAMEYITVGSPPREPENMNFMLKRLNASPSDSPRASRQSPFSVSSPCSSTKSYCTKPKEVRETSRNSRLSANSGRDSTQGQASFSPSAGQRGNKSLVDDSKKKKKVGPSAMPEVDQEVLSWNIAHQINVEKVRMRLNTRLEESNSNIRRSEKNIRMENNCLGARELQRTSEIREINQSSSPRPKMNHVGKHCGKPDAVSEEGHLVDDADGSCQSHGEDVEDGEILDETESVNDGNNIDNDTLVPREDNDDGRSEFSDDGELDDSNMHVSVKCHFRKPSEEDRGLRRSPSGRGKPEKSKPMPTRRCKNFAHKSDSGHRTSLLDQAHHPSPPKKYAFGTGTKFCDDMSDCNSTSTKRPVSPPPITFGRSRHDGPGPGIKGRLGSLMTLSDRESRRSLRTLSCESDSYFDFEERRRGRQEERHQRNSSNDQRQRAVNSVSSSSRDRGPRERDYFKSRDSSDHNYRLGHRRRSPVDTRVSTFDARSRIRSRSGRDNSPPQDRGQMLRQDRGDHRRLDRSPDGRFDKGQERKVNCDSDSRGRSRSVSSASHRRGRESID